MVESDLPFEEEIDSKIVRYSSDVTSFYVTTVLSIVCLFLVEAVAWMLVSPRPTGVAGVVHLSTYYTVPPCERQQGPVHRRLQ